MAAAHEQSSEQQIKLRTQMLSELLAIDNGLKSAINAEDEGADAQARELRAQNLEALLRFDAATMEYARLRKADMERLTPMRDTLAEFMKVRARLAELGCAAAETIKHEAVAKALEPHAFAANGYPGVTGNN